MTRRQTEHLKKAFLAAFAVHANISAACRAAGINRPQVYRWKDEDTDFAAAFGQAEVESTEVLEGEAFRRAREGVTSEKGVYYEGELVGIERKVEYSDTLLIFLLKARAPDKYRENVDVKHAGAVEIVYAPSIATLPPAPPQE